MKQDPKAKGGPKNAGKPSPAKPSPKPNPKSASPAKPNPKGPSPKSASPAKPNPKGPSPKSASPAKPNSKPSPKPSPKSASAKPSPKNAGPQKAAGQGAKPQSAPRGPAGSALRVIADGKALGDAEARDLWTRFSIYMDDHPLDFSGFAASIGFSEAKPEHRSGHAVLVLTS